MPSIRIRCLGSLWSGRLRSRRTSVFCPSGGAANVGDESPRDMLDCVGRNLERGAEAMGTQLEENEDLVRSEVEMVGNGG